MYPTFIGLLFTVKHFVICFHSCLFNLFWVYCTLRDILATVELHAVQWVIVFIFHDLC